MVRCLAPQPKSLVQHSQRSYFRKSGPTQKMANACLWQRGAQSTIKHRVKIYQASIFYLHLNHTTASQTGCALWASIEQSHIADDLLCDARRHAFWRKPGVLANCVISSVMKC